MSTAGYMLLRTEAARSGIAEGLGFRVEGGSRFRGRGAQISRIKGSETEKNVEKELGY